MAIHFIILSWEIPWTEELGGLQSMVSQKSQTQFSDHITTIVSNISFRYARKWLTYGHTCIFFFKFFSHLDYYRVLSKIPCSIYFWGFGGLLVIFVIFVWFYFTRSDNRKNTHSWTVNNPWRLNLKKIKT